jgi:hypothetical protein
MNELLEKLKIADPETFQAINDISIAIHGFDVGRNPNTRTIGHIIQGEIQIAISERGWPLIIAFDCNPDAPLKWNVDICSGKVNGLLGKACFDSPTEAILSAYLAALEAMS